jgi:hypothetical protein
MYISMQGPWTVRVKYNETDGTNRRFIISRTNTPADGNHSGIPGTAVFVNVPKDKLWTLNIQSNKIGSFQNSDTQIKFPVIQGSVYTFDIQSNDADSGSEAILDDLILTCSTPVNNNDFLTYGNVSTYGGRCFFNPCYPRWIVIETAVALQEALKNPLLSDIIHQLYPERIAHIPEPNGTKPFVPIMINLFDTKQSIEQIVNVFIKQSIETEEGKAKSRDLPYKIQYEKSIAIESNKTNISHNYNNIALAKLIDKYKQCWKTPAPFLNLRFEKYNRTVTELAGGRYTGEGIRESLGNIITDMNGNYILRFHQPFSEQIIDASYNVTPNTGVLVQYRPDMIVSLLDSIPASRVLYESAPHYNIPNLCRRDLCLPELSIPHGFSCLNGNLIGCYAMYLAEETKNKEELCFS